LIGVIIGGSTVRRPLDSAVKSDIVVRFENRTSTKPSGEATISRLLKSKNAKTRALVEEYRKTGNRSIKESLPCYTVSVIFSDRKNIISHSGIVCIDIDEKDNTKENFSEIKKIIPQVPYVAYCGLSCGGKGYFVLISIKYTDSEKVYRVFIFA